MEASLIKYTDFICLNIILMINKNIVLFLKKYIEIITSYINYTLPTTHGKNNIKFNNIL